jgi:uncharacterized protein
LKKHPKIQILITFAQKNSMNKFFALLFLLLSCPLFSQSDSAFIRDNFNKMEVKIPMRDGIYLFTSIYVPKDATQKYPILMKRTPYACRPYGVDKYSEGFQNMTLARAGYIFVSQDVRGKYMSEGDFEDVRPFNTEKNTAKMPNGKPAIDEASDTYDTVDWLLKNLPTNNGKVGVYGISYPGFYATMAILAGHPAIKAVSPQAPVTDWFIGDDFHHNGAFMLMDAFSFYSGFGKPRPTPTTESAAAFSDWKSQDAWSFYLKAGALPNYSSKFGMSGIPFWQDLMQHPNYDAWWKARNPRPHLKNIMPAVLTVGGLFDAEDCYGAWKVYEAIETQNPTSHSNRVVMGPWSHGGWARGNGDKLGNVAFGSKTSKFYEENIEFPFFEFYLKDKGTMDLPDAYVFETGSNRWTKYAAWPPRNAQKVKYFFQNNQNLSNTLVVSNPKSTLDTYVSDPSKPVPYTEDVHLNRTREYMTDDQRFAHRRTDVVAYQTEVLTAPLTVTGTVTADLLVTLRAKMKTKNLLDADFVVKLMDVFPDTLSGKSNGVPLAGYEMLVRGEIFRGRYRDSFEQPSGFKSGKPQTVKFDLPDVAHTFLPGHRMMVQVQSSWFPLADRNPQQFIDIYQAKDADFVPVEVTISAGSGVILSVLK